MAIRYLPSGPYAGWATDDNYDAGADPWSGNATKEEPSAGVLAKGALPEQQFPAQRFNWALNRAMGGAGILAHALMRTWQPYLIAVDASSSTAAEIGGYLDTTALNTFLSQTIAPYRCSLGTSSDVIDPAKPAIICVGNEVGDNEAAVWLSGDGSHWREAIGDIAFSGASPVFDVLGDLHFAAPRLVIASTADRRIATVQNSLDPGDVVFSANVAPSATHGIGGLHAFRVGAGTWALAGVSGTDSTTQRIFRSGDAGATWSAQTTPAGWDGVQIWAFASTNAAEADVATDVVLATGSKDGELLRSVDEGVTWSAVSLPANLASRGGAFAYQLAWSPVWQLFMCLNAQGSCAVSADGLNWTARGGTNPLAGAIHSSGNERGRLLAAVGPVFARAATCNAARDDARRRGVFYTLDSGFTWHFVDFGPTQTGTDQHLQGITNVGGAFAVWAPGKLWVSQSLWEAPVDLDLS